jgi:hypothetical protein
MNGFTKKTVGTLTLGEKLQKIRGDKRISLNEISRVTKIQLTYLEYLEAGDYDKLPAEVYVKGFLRSYADFFGIDEKIFLKLYKREREIKNNLKNNNNKNRLVEISKPINISPFVFTPKKIFLFIITIIVLGGIFLLYKEIDSFASAPSLLILNPQNNTETESNSIYIEGVTDKETRLFINDQTILVNDDGRFRENVILQKGLNVINIKAINKFDKETLESINVRSNWENEKSNPAPVENISDENVETPVMPETFQIDLRVEPGPVWLKVEADGELVFGGTMLSGAIQTFKAKEKIQISSGKGNATFVVFNGKEIGALSSDAKPARDVVFTKDFAKEIFEEKNKN